jgi:hypothetical protein
MPFIDGSEGEETREGSKNNRYPVDAPNPIPRQ